MLHLKQINLDNTMALMEMYAYIDLNYHLKFPGHKESSHTSQVPQVHDASLKGGFVHTICLF